MRTLYRYRFDKLVIDQSRREVVREGLPIEIAPKLFDLLVALAEAGGAVVSREELIRRVWGGRPTVDNVIATTVNRLRAALGKQHAELIESVPKVGYRLSATPQATALGTGSTPQAALRPGMEIEQGPGWVLGRLLAESAGRTVWLAHDASRGESRVFKFASSDQGLADLRREAGIARLLAARLGDRPDICPVIDWNFQSPPFFIAMPFAGTDLAAWLARSGWLADPDPSRRIGLLIQVADALAASHSIAVLHNDIKPENILIEAQAGELRLRLADFGCGQLTDPAVLQGLGLSSFGLSGPQGALSDPGWGGLKYLAPELLQGESATLGSDVYSLGVLLYQLAVADLSRPLSADWRRQVADPLLAEDIALATLSVPAERSLTARELAERLRRLPARRLEAEQAEQAARAQAHERAARERARQRRPWLIALFTSLALALAVTLTLYVQLLREQAAQARLLARVSALNGFLVDDLIGQANPDLSGTADLPVAAALGRAAAVIDTRFSGSGAGTRLEIHRATADAFAGIGNYPAALEEIRAALAAAHADPETAPTTLAELAVTDARYLGELDRNEDAERALAAAVSAWPGLPSAQGRTTALYWLARGVVAQSRLSSEQALPLYQTALRVAAAAPDIPPLEREHIQFDLADALRMSGRSAEAGAELERLVASRSSRLGADHPLTCFTEVLLARVQGDLGHPEQGIALAERARRCLVARLGEASRDVVTAAQVHADLQFQSGDYAGAAANYETVAASMQRTDGAVTLRYLTTRLNAGRAWHYAGELSRAEDSLRSLLPAAAAALGADHPVLSTIRYHLDDCLLDHEGPVGASRHLPGLDPSGRQRVARDLAQLDPAVLNRGELEPDWDGRLAFQRGRLALAQGRRAEALQLLEQARRIIVARNPDGRINEARIRAEEAFNEAPIPAGNRYRAPAIGGIR